ncbi:hypothetical protein [Hymenobacter terrestris]|uniref:Lipoprotein n=1 Tax=Hymenobacter terrestris TaxID=2748310 RepID=A0ABX2Q4I6_9BACT|nr:hypothetical protein [Hymenobacter terrestris]NVO85449.1 hypothetical protein [Hymenobacter terrestris]
MAYLSTLTRLTAPALAALGLAFSLAALPGCGSRSATDSEAATLAADSVQQPAPLDSAAMQRLAMRRDSLKADSIVKVSGQLPGAILPGKRIVAFYGNIRSKGMGILGREPKEQMFRKLKKVLGEWQAADPSRPVQGAIHNVTITAQGTPGKDGKWRLMNSKATIEEVISWGKEHNVIVFLDVQPGHSTLQAELPKLEQYLKDPMVHLGIDPEFSLATMPGVRPNQKIGTLDAKDINFTINFLARIVSENKLPPKVLTVHRFTRKMVSNYKNIKLDPRVQVVMHMDGHGEPTLKKDSYKAYVANEPVQYTGFKIFYEYDARPKPHHIMTPSEVIALTPSPLYIQYQ